jgi:hypothetical protein
MIKGKNSYFIIQRILSCFILCTISLFVHSQHLVGASRGYLASHTPSKQTSEQRKQYKQISVTQKKEKKQQEKAKKELLKGHIKLQDKATRKRMKSTLKKSKRHKKGIHLTPFWHKWKFKESNSIKRKRDVIDD